MIPQFTNAPKVSVLTAWYALNQTVAGHLICSECKPRLGGGKCPTCRRPMGDIRARGVEHIVATLSLPCKWSDNGCTFLGNHTDRTAHEQRCLSHALSVLAERDRHGYVMARCSSRQVSCPWTEDCNCLIAPNTAACVEHLKTVHGKTVHTTLTQPALHSGQHTVGNTVHGNRT